MDYSEIGESIFDRVRGMLVIRRAVVSSISAQLDPAIAACKNKLSNFKAPDELGST